MNRYSTETVDMFADIALDTPRYVPKAGGQWDLIDSAERPQTPEAPLPSREEGGTPPEQPEPQGEPDARYFFGVEIPDEDPDAYPRYDYGPDLELDRWAEWPEPGSEPSPYEAGALARWICLVEARKVWEHKRTSRWLLQPLKGYDRLWGLKTRHIRRLRHLLPERITLCIADRPSHPLAEPFVLPGRIEGARKLLSGEILPPRGRLFRYDIARMEHERAGAALAWNWVQRSTHPVALDIVDRVARDEVDLMFAGTIHSFAGHEGGYDAIRDERERDETWGMSGGRDPLRPWPADPCAFAIARMDRDDYRGQARRKRLAYHIERASDSDERHELVRRYLVAHGYHSAGRFTDGPRYWRTMKGRADTIYWGTTNEDAMRTPDKRRSLQITWGRKPGTWKPANKINANRIITLWSGYRGLDLNPDQGSLF